MLKRRNRSDGNGESGRRAAQKRRSTKRYSDSEEDVEFDGDTLDDDDVQISQVVYSQNQTNGAGGAGGDSGDDDDDDEEEEDSGLDFTQPDYAHNFSSSQPSASQDGESSKAKPLAIPSKVAQLSEKAIEDLTAQLVRYLLYKACLKLPIKFSDISKDVFPKYKNVSRYFFQKAKQQLEDVFGYQVVPVEDGSSKELYLVINGQDSQEHLQLVNKNDRCATRGLLMMVLGLLWCAPGRQLAEDVLWKQLALVDSTIRSSKDHRQLGDINQLIKTFETQMYLSSTTELDADLKKIKFLSYGPRTYLEIGKVQILNFVCKLITGRPPTQHQIDEVNLEST